MFRDGDFPRSFEIRPVLPDPFKKAHLDVYANLANLIDRLTYALIVIPRGDKPCDYAKHESRFDQTVLADRPASPHACA
jgi:hypothetical protein